MKNKLTVSLMGSLLFAFGALAQETAEQAAPVYSMSLKQAWVYGGSLMWVLAAMSVFGLALVFYFVLFLRESQIAPRAVVRDISAHLKADELTEARRICEDNPSPFTTIVVTALDTLRNAPKSDVSFLRDTVEAEGARQADSINGLTQLLLDLAAIAPMVGLLGTVMGMLKAFGSIAADAAAARPVVLAAGVSQAIVTTIFGLLIAIPAMACYAYFRRQASRQIAGLEGAVSQVATSLIDRYGK